MDSLTLAAVACELRRRVQDCRLGPVVLPRREQLALGLDDGAFLISIQAADARAHLVAELPAPPRLEPGLQAHFDSLLRGAAVTGVRVVDFDRILELTIDGLDRIGNPRRYRLIVELMGKHSACCLVDEDGLIVATLKTVTGAVNRHRQLLPRLPYVPPPVRAADPLPLTRDQFLAAGDQVRAAATVQAGWRALWNGLSEELWAWLCQAAGVPTDLAGGGLDQAAWERLGAAWDAVAKVIREDAWTPCLLRDEAGRPWRTWPLALPGSEPVASISAGLAAVAAAAAQRDALRSRRSDLLGRVGRELGRVESNLQGLHRRARRAAEAVTWQHWADLLLANLHRLEPRQEALTVEDYASPDRAEVTIPLDPALTGPRNAEALYQRARKARAGTAGLAAETAAAEARLAELQALREALRAARPEDLDRLARQVPAERRPAAPERPRTERDRVLRKLARHTSSDGYTILVGRNAAESEGLLSKVAAPTDLWLHVRGAGSGHVIIRTEGRPEAVPASTLEEAARLAARHSKMKHSELVPVVYTLRKHVTKIKGGQAGKVVYRQEKAIFVTP